VKTVTLTADEIGLLLIIAAEAELSDTWSDAFRSAHYKAKSIVKFKKKNGARYGYIPAIEITP
jgi:hypothetical protein